MAAETEDRATAQEPAGSSRHLSFDDLPPTLSVEQAAELVGVGRNTAYRAAHRGDIPAFRVGRQLRIPTAGLLRLLAIEQPPATRKS